MRRMVGYCTLVISHSPGVGPTTWTRFEFPIPNPACYYPTVSPFLYLHLSQIVFGVVQNVRNDLQLSN